MNHLTKLLIAGSLSFSLLGSGAGFAATPAGAPVDVKKGHWAESAVQSLVQRGIVKLPKDQKFRGDKGMSRYEMASVVSQTLKEVDQTKAQAISAEDARLLQSLVKELAEEVLALKKNRDKLEAENKSISDKFAEFSKSQEERLAKVEKTAEKAKQPVTFNGDWRYRYATTRIRDNFNGKGLSSADFNRVRLGGKVPVDDSLFGYFRFWTDQPVRRNGDANDVTTFRTDLLYLKKKDAMGGEWTVGRQYGQIGNGMLQIDFYDGLTYTRRFDKEFAIKATVQAQNTTPAAGKSHGLHGNTLSFEYNPAASQSVMLSRFGNSSDLDKFGVTNPKTSEEWYSLDLKGNINDRWEYFGVAAAYKNQLNGTNTTAQQQHLRGDQDNTAYLVGVKYDQPKKFSMGTIWAQQMNNFRSFDVLNDVYYLDFPTHPLEDALVALSLQANNARTNAMEGVLPPTATAAAPLNTPIPVNSVARGTDNRPSGAYLGDIHGYRDFQVNTQYFFRSDLSLRIVADWMVPAKSSYNYKDVTAFTSRLRYQYNPKTFLEFRAVRVSSEYSRTIDDFRTEFFMRF